MREVDPRGNYKEGYKFALRGGKPSKIRDKNGNIIGFRAGEWLDGFRQAQLDIREGARTGKVVQLFPKRFKLSSKWKDE